MFFFFFSNTYDKKTFRQPENVVKKIQCHRSIFIFRQVQRKIEALSKIYPFCRKAKHKTHCSLLTANYFQAA